MIFVRICTLFVNIRQSLPIVWFPCQEWEAVGISHLRSRGRVCGAFEGISIGTNGYLNAMSRIIIVTKPAITPIVAKSVCPPRCDSGSASSTTTKIIAPAAKAMA